MHGYSMNKLIEYRCQVGFAYSEVERCYGVLWRCREKTKSILRKMVPGISEMSLSKCRFPIEDQGRPGTNPNLGSRGPRWGAFLHFYQI